MQGVVPRVGVGMSKRHAAHGHPNQRHWLKTPEKLTPKNVQGPHHLPTQVPSLRKLYGDSPLSVVNQSNANVCTEQKKRSYFPAIPFQKGMCSFFKQLAGKQICHSPGFVGRWTTPFPFPLSKHPPILASFQGHLSGKQCASTKKNIEKYTVSKTFAVWHHSSCAPLPEFFPVL